MQRTTFTADLRRAASGVLTTALMAAGAVALAPSAQAATGQTGQQAATEQRPAATNGTKAAQGAAAARSTQVTLGNYTGHGLTKTWEKLDHGCWTKDMLPPDYIPNGRVPSWASESCGFATGTEGRAVYAIAGGGEISLHWNNPYVGSNSYSCFVPDGYTCSRTGGSGDNAQVRFDVRPKSQLTQARTTAAVPGATAARSTTVSLTNNSGTLLTRAGSNLHWGVWSDGLLPPPWSSPVSPRSGERVGRPHDRHGGRGHLRRGRLEQQAQGVLEQPLLGQQQLQLLRPRRVQVHPAGWHR